jgi:hypothetical protein
VRAQDRRGDRAGGDVEGDGQLDATEAQRPPVVPQVNVMKVGQLH